MTQSEIAEAFSGGNFEAVFPYLAESIQWRVIGEFELEGKGKVIEKCKETANYFSSVKTDFRTLNVIAGKNKVAVNGTAEFIRDNKRVSFVSACDVYEFGDGNKLVKITSYCIQDKK